jgi:hypothetical protein
MIYEQEAKLTRLRQTQSAYGEQAAQVGGIAPIARTLSPVECEMQELSELLSILHKRLSTLEEKLHPVLHGQIDKPQPGQPPCETTTGVPLADHLRSLRGSAISLRDCMDDILERVAV